MKDTAKDLVESILGEIKEAISAAKLVRDIQKAKDLLNEADANHSRLEKALLSLDDILTSMTKLVASNATDPEKLEELQSIFDELETECLVDLHRSMKVAVGDTARIPRIERDIQDMNRRRQ